MRLGQLLPLCGRSNPGVWLLSLAFSAGCAGVGPSADRGIPSPRVEKDYSAAAPSPLIGRGPPPILSPDVGINLDEPEGGLWARQLLVEGLAAEGAPYESIYEEALVFHLRRASRDAGFASSLMRVSNEDSASPEQRAYAQLVLAMACGNNPQIREALVRRVLTGSLLEMLACLHGLAHTSGTWCGSKGEYTAQRIWRRCRFPLESVSRAPWRVLWTWFEIGTQPRGPAPRLVDRSGQIVRRIASMDLRKTQRCRRGELPAWAVQSAALLFDLDPEDTRAFEFAQEVARRALDGQRRNRPVLEAALYFIAERAEAMPMADRSQAICELCERVPGDDVQGIVFATLALDYFDKAAPWRRDARQRLHDKAWSPIRQGLDPLGWEFGLYTERSNLREAMMEAESNVRAMKEYRASRR